jgi:hypothetical protein
LIFRWWSPQRGWPCHCDAHLDAHCDAQHDDNGGLDVLAAGNVGTVPITMSDGIRVLVKPAVGGVRGNVGTVPGTMSDGIQVLVKPAVGEVSLIIKLLGGVAMPCKVPILKWVGEETLCGVAMMLILME